MKKPSSAQAKQTAEAALRKHIGECLKLLGYDLKHPDMIRTPYRAARIWMEELHVDKPPSKKLFSVFPAKYDQMVVMVGHKTWTRCPHHLERVRLTVSIGYLPNGRVIGLSKLARIADWYALGMQLQEGYVENLAEGLMCALEPKGVGIHVEGQHLCMKARGVESEGDVVTTALRGMFFERPETQREFLQYVMHHKAKGVIA